MTCYLYLLRAASGHVKIGISRNPKSRLAGVRTGCPFAVNLIAAFPMKDRNTAILLEAELHQAYAEYRTNGEWFEIEHEPVLWSMQETIEGYLSELEGGLWDLKRAALLEAHGVDPDYYEAGGPNA